MNLNKIEKLYKDNFLEIDLNQKLLDGRIKKSNF